MLGNLGYSSVNCMIIPLAIADIDISCTYGYIGNITQMGVSNPSLDAPNPNNICVVNEYNDACTPNS